MDIKEVLSWLIDPRLLAAVGGYMTYKYVGKGKPGYQPWLYGAGGAVAGYLVGRVAQTYLAAPAPVVAPAVKQAAGYAGPPQLPAHIAADPREAELRQMIAQNEAAAARGVDLDAASHQLAAAPTPMSDAEVNEQADDAMGSYKRGTPIEMMDRRRVEMDTASIAPEDMAVLDGKGSYGDSMEGEGLGSYAGDEDEAVTEALREEKAKRQGRAN
jgi:hypothetical protein